MNCENCGFPLASRARFCSHCGAPVSGAEGIAPEALTIEWLKAVLIKMGYEIDVDEGEPHRVLAMHKTRVNIIAELPNDYSSVGFRSFWKTNATKVGWAEKARFLAALNRANEQAWLGKFTVEESFDSGTTFGQLTVCDRMSERDVMAFVDEYDREQRDVFARSGLGKFALQTVLHRIPRIETPRHQWTCKRCGLENDAPMKLTQGQRWVECSCGERQDV